MKVVVVGAGLGGVNVCEQLRRAGHTGPLVLVGDETAWPYDRPPLSKAALQDGTPAPLLRPVEDWPALDVDLRRGTTAVRLDAAAREVHLSGGEVAAYDALVLAPGAAPRRLPGPAAGMHVLRTQDDAAALRRDLLATGRLTVVGGGFLGCEAAASARRLDAEVDLVELLPGPLVRVLGPEMAARVRALHEQAGVRLHCGTGVQAVLGHDAVTGVALDDGTVLDTRTVLVALGVRPATGWLADSLPLAPDGGIVCEAAGLAADGVWAVGDAAAWGGARRVEHWTSAVEQAAAVAKSLLGLPAPEATVPYVWSEQYDSVLQCVGELDPGTEVEVLEVDAGLAALHADGDRLLGAALLDLRKQTGRVRRVLLAGGTAGEARAALLR